MKKILVIVLIVLYGCSGNIKPRHDSIYSAISSGDYRDVVAFVTQDKNNLLPQDNKPYPVIYALNVRYYNEEICLYLYEQTHEYLKTENEENRKQVEFFIFTNSLANVHFKICDKVLDNGFNIQMFLPDRRLYNDRYNVWTILSSDFLTETARLAILNYLVSKNADIREINPLILKISATSGYSELVQRLIEVGMDIHAIDHEGKNAAFYATEYNNIAMLETLLEAGIDCTYTSPYNFSCIHFVNSKEAIALLIQYGADLNQKGGENNIGIIDVLIRRYLSAVEVFTKENHVDETQNIETKYYDALSFALQQGADVNYYFIAYFSDNEIKYNTPLYYAEMKNCPQRFIDLLKSYGAESLSQDIPDEET
ncbi:ankyrin repeat domain-containing protein [Breznakiella homolactica]|uniref:Ankyrin repeat domain-containing protein n=1 Tax=Breznakiella homolactica TaxID=2798577 RepID=A0A7T7XMJ3_9SPIR|nr:ankyrin repeat domain-containing protein [Breznakiella homolactica]QQO09023.1 ankyrin repeat domain-containing protein [Breznakiella homolactica]